METGQDASEAGEGAYSSPTPEKLLFVDMANQSQASQASSRKKARSHIMSRYHRRARILRVSWKSGISTIYDSAKQS
jgi:hypothetical protein